MQRREILHLGGVGLAAAALACPSVSRSAKSTSTAAVGTTFLVAHGAWSAGWAWKKMHPLLSAAGHRLITPTYTGLGERAHLASATNDLEMHIQDMLGVIKYEDLSEIVLVGHSYGGMVATGVADRVRDRIAKLVYLDAFVPKDREAQADLIPNGRIALEDRAKANDGWRVPPNPTPSDTSEVDQQWITDRRLPQSLQCFLSPINLASGETTLPRTYIYCKRAAPGDVFRRFAERAKSEKWGYFEMDASHAPHITAPDALAAILRSVAESRS